MLIKTKIRGKEVSMALHPIPMKEKGLIGFYMSMQGIDWEGKEGQVLEHNDENFKVLMDYIDQSEFVLPDLK